MRNTEETQDLVENMHFIITYMLNSHQSDQSSGHEEWWAEQKVGV